MLILAIESSAKPVSVAVSLDDKLLGQYYQNSSLTHSRTLLAMTESLIKNLDIKLSEIDLFAVSRGPGSFTGIRIGVSAVKGLAWGKDKPVCGISTLEAMAYQLSDSGVFLSEQSSVICPVMDAKRQQVYNALFKLQNGSPLRIKEDRAISLEELTDELRDINSNYILVGDGALISYEVLCKNDIKCMLTPSLLRYQTAYGVSRAALHAPLIDAAALEPIYLRPSQAERLRTLPPSSLIQKIL